MLVDDVPEARSFQRQFSAQVSGAHVEPDTDISLTRESRRQLSPDPVGDWHRLSRALAGLEVGDQTQILEKRLCLQGANIYRKEWPRALVLTIYQGEVSRVSSHRALQQA